MTVAAIVVTLLVLIVARVPVAFAILVPSLAYVLMDPSLTLDIALQRISATLDSFPLLAVPLFIFVGFVADASGMAARLVDALQAVLGRVRGSLGYVNVAGSLTFSWMSGSSTADAAAMGSIMVPNMRRHGYKPGFASGLTGAAAMIGPIMPPSVAAILYAVLARTSVGGMFLAGVLPALVIVAGLSIYVFVHTKRHPEIRSTPVAVPDAVRAVAQALPVLFTPVIILGGILLGVFTATEAAAVAGVYLIVLGFTSRWLKPKRFLQALVDTAATTGTVMLIATAGGMLAYVLAREGAPAAAADALLSLTESPAMFLLLLNASLLVLGMFLEPASALLITVPVVLPIALEYGIDPVHLGTIMILNLTIGLLTPPVGLVLYVLSNVGKTDLNEVVRGTLPALTPLIATLLIITYIPQITLILPRLISG